MPSWFEDIATPNTASLEVARQGLTDDYGELQKYAGMAGSQIDMRADRQSRAALDYLASRGQASSTTYAKTLGEINAQAIADKNAIDYNLGMHKMNVKSQLNKLNALIPLARTQEIYGDVKSVVGTAAEIGGAFIPGVGPLVSAAGAALAGSGAQSASAAMGMAQDYQDQQNKNRLAPLNGVQGLLSNQSPAMTGGDFGPQRSYRAGVLTPANSVPEYLRGLYPQNSLMRL